MEHDDLEDIETAQATIRFRHDAVVSVMRRRCRG